MSNNVVFEIVEETISFNITEEAISFSLEAACYNPTEEIIEKIDSKADIDHTHVMNEITDLTFDFGTF